MRGLERAALPTWFILVCWLLTPVLIVAVLLFAANYCPADRAQFCDRHPISNTDQSYDRQLMNGNGP